MWMQWSITRLVRWRVRDWASCFTACRFPLDDDGGDNDAYRSSPPQLPIRNMVRNERKGNRTSKKLLRKKKRYGSIDEDEDYITRNNNLVSAENASNNNDEDYIVFCFREDGAFDVVKDAKSEASNRIDCTRRSSWPVNRKISFGENAKAVNSNEDGHDDVCSTNEAEIIPVKEDKEEEEEVVYLDIGSGSSNCTRYQTEGMVSVESSDSSRSDNSTASFAFPALGWEWLGSPAQMPKSEGLHLRKHKARSLTFQCCRF